MPDEACPASPDQRQDGHSALPDGLVLVSTPIGNLGDLTPRARETLLAADLILCEDTRHTAGLLAAIGAKVKLQSLHEHNEDAAIPAVLAQLRRGRCRTPVCRWCRIPAIAWCARRWRRGWRSAWYRAPMPRSLRWCCRACRRCRF